MSTIAAARPAAAPDSWDPALDAVVAAPANHQVLYEDDLIRVLSVSIEPDKGEPLHHHRWPSVFVIDRLVKLRDFDSQGREIKLPIPDEFEAPLTLRLPPQEAHMVRNEDSTAFHGTRIEFKRGYPKP